MRRIWAFICMVLSLVVMIVFNAQSIYEANNLSLEYNSSKEVVIQVDQREGGISLNRNDISSKITSRLDLSGASNYQVEVQINSSDTSIGEVRVKLSSKNDEEYNNIVRILESNNNLTLTNSNGDEISYTEVLGDSKNIMELDYDGINPKPKFVIGNITKYNEFIAKNDSITDETLKKNIYVWANKTEEDTYDRAFGNEKEGIEAVSEVKNKIIATLSTDNYSKQENEDYGYFSVSTDEKGNSFTISSARSYVNALNATDYGFNVKHLYENIVNPVLASNSRSTLLIGYGVGLLLLIIGFCLAYSLSGLLASLSIATSTMFVFLIANFVGFIFTPVTSLAVIFSIVTASFVLVYTFNRIQIEYIKGRSIEKCHYEGFRKSFKPNIAIGFVVFFTSLFTFFLGKGVIKSFSGYLVIGSILSTFVSYYLAKFISYWLFTSPLINKNLSLLGIRKEENKLSKKLESKTYVSYDNKKKSKIVSCSVFALTCIVVLATFLGLYFTKGANNIFNNSLDYKNAYRINVTYVTEREISDEQTYTDFNDFASDLNSAEELKDIFNTNEDVASYTFNRVETYDIEKSEKTYTYYISMLVEKDLSDDQIATLQGYITTGLDGRLALYSNTPISFDTSVSAKGDVIHNNFYFYLCSGMIVVFASCLILLVYGLYASLQVGLLLAIEYGLGMSLLALTRLPFNSFTEYGVYFSLLATSITLIPVYQRFRELRKDTKSKKASLEEQIKLFNTSFQENFISICAIDLFIFIIGLVCIFAGGSSLFSAGIIMIVMTLIGFIYTTTLAGYDYMNFRDTIKLKPIHINIKHNKKKDIINKNEPQEAIVPGINDF